MFAKVLIACLVMVTGATASGADSRPNVLIMISDDVSYPHASAYGSRMVDTPAFDRVASEGVLFDNAYCCAPGCSPSRAAFLTGRHIWMIEEAGTHASYFPIRYATFPERLSESGYFAGSVGKGWGPGNFRKDGRSENPAGRSFSRKGGYVEGFRQFLRERPSGKPFCFWFGSHDAHRSYEKGSGLASGKTLDQAEVPAFLPDAPEIRSDLLDYAFEVERFDRDCEAMLNVLDQAGELDNTLVIVTSDNGMPFPRAKANCYDFGIHMPLAICWKQQFPVGRRLTDMVSFVDLTATIYEATGCSPPDDAPLAGRSLLSGLKSEESGQVDPSRTSILSGRERHSSSRFNSLGYPQRALRENQYLYIHNFRPERSPAGPGQKYGKVQYGADGKVALSELGDAHAGYHDIDACPSLSFLISNRERDGFGKFLGLAVDHRPQEELFDVVADPACVINLALDREFDELRVSLKERLMKQLRETGDARVLDGGDIWESYPRVSGLRWFPEPQWVLDGGRSVPAQPWVESRRPRASPAKGK